MQFLAQSVLSLRWKHMSESMFSYVVARFLMNLTLVMLN